LFNKIIKQCLFERIFSIILHTINLKLQIIYFRRGSVDQIKLLKLRFNKLYSNYYLKKNMKHIFDYFRDHGNWKQPKEKQIEDRFVDTCEQGNLDALKVCINNILNDSKKPNFIADIFVKDFYYKGFSVAAQNGYLQILEHLISEVQKVINSSRDRSYDGVWIVAAGFGYIDVLKYILLITPENQRQDLIHAKRYIYGGRESKYNAWMHASSKGRLNVMKFLLLITNPDKREVEDAWVMAAENGHLHVLKFLIELIPDQVAREEMIHADKEAAWTRAFMKGHLPVMEYLIELTTDQNHKNQLLNSLRTVIIHNIFAGSIKNWDNDQYINKIKAFTFLSQFLLPGEISKLCISELPISRGLIRFFDPELPINSQLMRFFDPEHVMSICLQRRALRISGYNSVVIEDMIQFAKGIVPFMSIARDPVDSFERARFIMPEIQFIILDFLVGNSSFLSSANIWIIIAALSHKEMKENSAIKIVESSDVNANKSYGLLSRISDIMRNLFIVQVDKPKITFQERSFGEYKFVSKLKDEIERPGLNCG
jgi:hypothetical protein